MYGELVREHRRRAGLTQQEVADRAGMSVAGLRDIEQGRVRIPRPGTRYRLGATLDLPVTPASGGSQTDTAPASPVWLGVLGPLVVRVDGAEVNPGSGAQQVLLGLLALSPNAPVGWDRLLDRVRLAGRTALTTGGLAARISRLRRRLRSTSTGTAGPALLADAGGYRLLISEHQLDLLAFRALVRRARAARVAGSTPRACAMLAEAVQLWRGDPLAGLAMLTDDPLVLGLSREWRTTVVEYATLAAELGRYEEVVPLLHKVVADDPLHEAAHARLMVALGGTGRQAEALLVFDGLRRRLARELGAAPGRELVEAHRQVLRQTVVQPSSPAAATRASLPADLAGFRGRCRELRWLRERLPSAPGAPPVVLAIEGMPGVGKSRLALHLAHELVGAGYYHERQLYVDLAGATDPAAALGSLLSQLGVPDDRMPADLSGRIARYRQLAGGGMLVLLDDAGGAPGLAPLLPESPDSLVLVTSRQALGLGHRLTLAVPSRQEAIDLFAAQVGAGRVAADQAAAELVVERCNRLPLALTLLARRLQIQPAWTLAEAAARLAGGDRLDLLAAGSRSVRAAFRVSYHALPPPAQRLFRLLGGHPPEGLTTAELRRATSTSPDLGGGGGTSRATLADRATAAKGASSLAAAVDLLRRAHLLAVVGDLYWLPGLLWNYARELAQGGWDRRSRGGGTRGAAEG